MRIELLQSTLPAMVVCGALLLSASCGGGVKMTQDTGARPAPTAVPSATPVATPAPEPTPTPEATPTPTPGAPAGVPAVLASVIPGEIEEGKSAVLFWMTEGADSVSVDEGIGSFEGSEGAVRISPTATTTYEVTATGPGGTSRTSLTLTVIPRT